jgi:hypothetical protein
MLPSITTKFGSVVEARKENKRKGAAGNTSP